jgi:aldehyde dehydrogenase (NAD+)
VSDIERTRTGLYIDGAWVDTDETAAVTNPATEQDLGTAPVGTVVHAETALTAARAAADDRRWSGLSPKDRTRLLRRFTDALRDREDALVELIIDECGAPGRLAKILHYRTGMDHFDWYVDAADRDPIEPRRFAPLPGGGTGAAVVVREPAGVVAAITPFNFPFFLNVQKVAPALAAGNCVVLKPSPLTPLEALVLADVAEEVELPAGVFNVVTGGLDVGRALTTDPRVDLVSFTGSDLVGAAVMAQASPNLTRVLLELGGKSALIVRDDADLDVAVPTALMNFITQAGQGCALCTRHIVHESIHDAFVEQLVAFTAMVPVGDPHDRGTAMGPLISAAQRERVEGFVATARNEGAILATGGSRPAGLDRGFFFEPTVFTDVANSSTLARSEVFGPVAAVISFADDDEAVAIANDSPYGLAGAIVSRDTDAAFRMALGMHTGYVTINGGSGAMDPALPFGGVGRSGIGRELGVEGLDCYTETKSIDMRIT